ncbi:MAG: hypothetical protein OEW48_18605, partial [Phycisphaerae bacterium]|nr:hypothetical protein [Phycisphaerae bacterium]
LPPLSGTRVANIAPAVPPWFPRLRATQLSEQVLASRRLIANSLITGPGNGGQARRIYLEDVRLAAPEGFSTRWSAPAHTTPGFAASLAQAYSFPSSPFSVKLGWIMP